MTDEDRASYDARNRLIRRQGDACRHAVDLTEKYAMSGRGADELAAAWEVAADAAEEAGDMPAANVHRERAHQWRVAHERGALWAPPWSPPLPPPLPLASPSPGVKSDG